MRYVLIPLDVNVGRVANRVSELYDDVMSLGAMVDGDGIRSFEAALQACGLKVVGELRGDLDEYEEG